ncbi:unnamed protein product [Closterium sp. Naga37s-1]|nr:unnamed protein product [Closterium sp. Naga37s-1]
MEYAGVGAGGMEEGMEEGMVQLQQRLRSAEAKAEEVLLVKQEVSEGDSLLLGGKFTSPSCSTAAGVAHHRCCASAAVPLAVLSHVQPLPFTSHIHRAAPLSPLAAHPFTTHTRPSHPHLVDTDRQAAHCPTGMLTNPLALPLFHSLISSPHCVWIAGAKRNAGREAVTLCAATFPPPSALRLSYPLSPSLPLSWWIWIASAMRAGRLLQRCAGPLVPPCPPLTPLFSFPSPPIPPPQLVDLDRQRNAGREAITALKKHARGAAARRAGGRREGGSGGGAAGEGVSVEAHRPLVTPMPAVPGGTSGLVGSSECAVCGAVGQKERVWVAMGGGEMFVRLPLHHAHVHVKRAGIDRMGEQMEEGREKQKVAVRQLTEEGGLAGRVGEGIVHALTTLKDASK